MDLSQVLRSATARAVITLGHPAQHDGSTDHELVLGQVPDPALPPDLLLLTFDACQRLLGLLATAELRQVAVWKLAGHIHEAIRTKLGCSRATAARTSARIRATWQRAWGAALPCGPAKSGPRRGSSESAGDGAFPSGVAIDSDDAAKILRALAGLP